MPLDLPATAAGWGGLLVSYLLGAIPFGLVLGFLVGGLDIRSQGSGNIGATNVGRALGRPWAIAAFLLDAAKGWAPAFYLPHVVLALGSSEESEWGLRVLYGFAAVCGHVWPLYLRFKGGKGVATLAGAVIAVDPLIFLGGGAVWLVTLGTTRYVGLSSLMMSLSFPFLAAWRLAGRPERGEVVWGTALLTALVFLRHRANFARMLAGTEPKAGRKREA